MHNSSHKSTTIRSLLAQGNVREANDLLGSQYQMQGTVVHGDHLGRKLGFPTANLELPVNTPLQLAFGVYAVFVNFSGKRFQGVVNIGTRPTLNGNELRIEVNIFGFNGNLYGETLTLDFVERIRDEKKFGSLNDLTNQIQMDSEVAIKLLSRTDQSDSNP